MTQHRIGTANNYLLHRKKKEVKIKKTGKTNQIKMKMSIINVLNSSSFCCITQLPKILTPWRHAHCTGNQNFFGIGKCLSLFIRDPGGFES